MSYKTGTNNLIDVLKAIRVRNGVSQRVIAEAIGMTQGRISNIERGTADVPLSVLTKYAHALDVEIIAIPRKYIRFVDGLMRKNRL